MNIFHIFFPKRLQLVILIGICKRTLHFEDNSRTQHVAFFPKLIYNLECNAFYMHDKHVFSLNFIGLML